jgi:hypothetical protein
MPAIDNNNRVDTPLAPGSASQHGLLAQNAHSLKNNRG